MYKGFVSDGSYEFDRKNYLVYC